MTGIAPSMNSPTALQSPLFNLGFRPFYLLAAALLSDTGGVATLIGDPPNLMIGSAKDISFNTFIYHMGGIVFFAHVSALP